VNQASAGATSSANAAASITGLPTSGVGSSAFANSLGGARVVVVDPRFLNSNFANSNAISSAGSLAQGNRIPNVNQGQVFRFLSGPGGRASLVPVGNQLSASGRINTPNFLNTNSILGSQGRQRIV